MILLGGRDAQWVSRCLLANFTFQEATEPELCGPLPEAGITTASFSHSQHFLGSRNSEKTIPSRSLSLSLESLVGLIKAGSPQINPNKWSQDSYAG